ncbi:MAG: T9SS type A sorting domain-containing protein [Flavobacteriales bacterium]
MKSLIYTTACSLFLSICTSAQQYYPQNFAPENGYISKLLQSNDTLFATGEFYVGGYEIGSLIRYVGDNRTELDSDMPYIDNGQVTNAVPDGNGGWYVATWGGISYAGETRRGVIHINPDKSLDENFPLMQTTSFGGIINVLHLHNNILYVGGSFNEYAGVTKPQLLAYNTTTGQIVQDWNTGLAYGSTQYVSALAVHGNKLIVGGELSSSAGQPVNNLGIFNLQNGTMINNLNANGEVRRIIIDVDTAYVGGRFSTVSGVTRNGLVKINLSDNSQLSIAANFNSYVDDFKISGTDLYAGGWFTEVNGISRSGLVKMNRYSGEVNTDFNVIIDQARVQCLDIVNENLIFGGNFMQVNGFGREKLAQVDKNTGMLSTWNSSVASIPEGITNVDGNLVIYGDMNQLQRSIRNSFVALKLPERTLLPVGFTSAAFGLSLRDMVKQGNKIYFATGFNNTINGTSTGLLFAYDLQTQEIQSIGTFGGLANPAVDRLLIHDGKLYVSGFFTQVNGESRNRIAVFNLDDYSLNAWNPAPEYSFAATTMKVHNGKLFMSGFITQTQTSTQYVACALNLSDATWAGGLLRDPASGISYSGNDLLINGNNIFLAGHQFVSYSPLVRSAVLKMNEQFEVDANFVAQMAENTTGSSSLTMINGVLVSLHRISQEFRRLYFHSPLNGDTLLNLPIDFEGSAPFTQQLDSPESYVLNNDLLYIGGNWDRVNGNNVRGLAIIDGRTVPFPDLNVSIENFISENEQNILVYPNPAKNQIWLKGINEAAQVQMLDIKGRLIQSWHRVNDVPLYISGIPAGIYLLQVQTQEKLHYAKVVIH